MTHRTLWICCLAVMLLSPLAHAQNQKHYPQAWNMVGADLSSDQGLDKFIALLKQSKDAGCTHILLGDSRWLRAADDPAYLSRVAKAKAAAKDLNLALVPSVYCFGYSGRYLAFDPNLGVGLPVKDMPFLVKGRAATADPAAALDTTTFSPDTAEVRYKVKPFSYYKISLYTKEKPGKGPGEEGEAFRAWAVKPTRWLTRSNPYLKQVGDRWLSMNTFNTLDADEIRVQVFVKDYQQFKIEPAGALIILRRDTLPLKVTSEDGQTVYQEGKDFKKLVDPNIAKGSGDFEADHDPNPIELTDNSSISDGQKLLVSFYHSYKIYAHQNLVTMEDPRIYDLMEKDVANCVKVWGILPGYFMTNDEIRIGGWEPLTLQRHLTPAQLLAAHTQKGIQIIKKHAPDATVYTWSDMYDPYHNAGPLQDNGSVFYLVNGTWRGSWEGLPKDVIIGTWNSKPDSLKWFADRHHQQILAGYYDAPDTNTMKANIHAWMQASHDVPNILGLMYTQWGSGFVRLNEYFQLLNTYDQWSKSQPDPKPEE